MFINCYRYPVYKARNQLAAIDYQKHLHRQNKLDKEVNPQ